jgi:hypothetical protein
VRTSLATGGRAVAVAVACAAILAGATACESTRPPSANPLAGLTADQIVKKAEADLKASSSVHIAGSAADSGQTEVIDVTAGEHGCEGTFRISGAGSFAFLDIGTTEWIKEDSQFLKTLGIPAKVLKRWAGKYVQIPGTPSSMTGFCSPSQIAGNIGSELKGPTEGKVMTVLGRPALQIWDKRHSNSVYVTISAHPKFVRLVFADQGQGHLDFTGYNLPVTLTPPPANETINDSQLAALATQAAGLAPRSPRG